MEEEGEREKRNKEKSDKRGIFSTCYRLSKDTLDFLSIIRGFFRLFVNTNAKTNMIYQQN